MEENCLFRALFAPKFLIIKTFSCCQQSQRYFLYRYTQLNRLKRHNQAKIIQKSVILFWLLNMTK